MSATTGDFVTPGNRVEIPTGSSLGSGLSETESGAIALVSGTLISDGDTISVNANRPETNSPQIGDDVIAEVTKLMPKVAMVRILHIEKDSGHRDLSAENLFADIFVTEIVDRFLPSPGDAMRTRDLIRARITQLEPNLKARTRGSPELGVLWAICPACGNELVTSDDKQDFNVDCNRCDYLGYRALSNGFGHGHTLGEDIQTLNRAGERWSAEAESNLGHEGARPYLSPMADHRRGLSHQASPAAMRMRAAITGKGRGGTRQRVQHECKCTLCGTDTTVPFEPTPGKPIRCKDCMDKVNDGKATKEELAAEREVLTKARSESSELAGIKLFIARLSFDASEDELRNHFSAHGEITDCSIAKDRETGKSRGFAFVKFSSRKAGEKAIKELDGSEIRGRKISVQESNDGGGRRGDRGKGNRRRNRR
ncbi:MAG: CxxC-x17-CxxC domain-containing protein [Candidatus Thermoplasmatota archaeon]|nr:CxxC-x17-CxxC domain-containing protein [Candidatus Thermoplasmatota archaeon]